MIDINMPINIAPTTRNFVNVGQALFAIEEHNGKTIVYDCGGESRLIVAAVLPYILRKNSVIDILFISHYDNDHINGVQYLLHHCHIRHIVLPMVEEEHKLFAALSMPDSSFAYKFTLNPSQTISEEIYAMRDNGDRDKVPPRIHFVNTAEHSYGDANISEPMSIDDFENNQNIPENKAICIEAPNDDWIYLPFNRKVMTSNQWEDFLSFLHLPLTAKSDDIIAYWKEHWIDERLYEKPIRFPYERRHPLKDAWQVATGIPYRDINEYSMTLYSGPSRNIGTYGCLYTGDYNAKKYITELYNFYIRLWGNIKVIQIPHHGSINNFDNQLIIHDAIHVIPNKEAPYRQSDVRYQTVWDLIENKGEKVVGAWGTTMLRGYQLLVSNMLTK